MDCVCCSRLCEGGRVVQEEVVWWREAGEVVEVLQGGCKVLMAELTELSQKNEWQNAQVRDDPV